MIRCDCCGTVLEPNLDIKEINDGLKIDLCDNCFQKYMELRKPFLRTVENFLEYKKKEIGAKQLNRELGLWEK
jgi:hypothetical protein